VDPSVILGSIDRYISAGSIGGPGYLATGPSYLQICFPDYWQKHLELKQWYMAQYPFIAGRRLIDGKYSVNYSSITVPTNPYYPNGPYAHQYNFKRALAICCANDPTNGQ
jgi:hypothetical protein